MDDDPHAPARAEYAPEAHSVRQRKLSKLAELREGGEEVGLSTLRRMRSRFEREGVAGLVDGRQRKPATGTGRTDPRVVAAIEKVVDSQTNEATVSAQVLRRQVKRLLEDEHAGDVPMPSRATYYRLLEAVSTGRHLLGSARTRRSLGKQPKQMFGQLTAVRPGEVMEMDSTPLNVMVVHNDETVDRCELTGLVDLATRTLAAAVLRPSTKAVDAALLLARTMTPERMRPGWSDALRMSRSVLPYASLLPLDERLAKAAARPVIVPETRVSDRGKVFVSDKFRNACRHLRISFQPAHPDTPTDKPHIERTLGSVATMFAQYVVGTGRSAETRGKHPASPGGLVHPRTPGTPSGMGRRRLAGQNARRASGPADSGPSTEPEREVRRAGGGSRIRAGRAQPTGIHPAHDARMACHRSWRGADQQPHL
ncbi:hypothetical protein [Streptomyces sp. NPDC095817]|uniref:hypothetical protein n=1 Tax=Streptomyces sp. NPDC095817 TaxID=3155082 RepID=UPI00332FB8D0